MLQPTSTHKKRRKSRIQSIQEETQERRRSNSSNSRSSKGKDKDQSSRPLLSKLTSHSSSTSSKSDRSQLVDLVVEDHEAEQVERVRARKEGSPAWNEAEAKHFVYVALSCCKWTQAMANIMSIAELTQMTDRKKQYAKATNQTSPRPSSPTIRKISIISTGPSQSTPIQTHREGTALKEAVERLRTISGHIKATNTILVKREMHGEVGDSSC